MSSEAFYDVVIVGSGVSGSIIAKELAQSGFSVLMLEAGPGHDLTIAISRARCAGAPSGIAV